MKQKNFHVSIKTIDGMPVFPPAYDGQKLLFPFVMQAALRIGVISIGFATFPTGVEVVVNCNDPAQAKGFADALCSLIYEHNNAIGHVIDSFGINIGELTDEEETLHAFMMDMMMRSMIARGELNDLPDSSGGSGEELYHVDIDLNDLDNVKITPLGMKGKAAGFMPGSLKSRGKKRFS